MCLKLNMVKKYRNKQSLPLRGKNLLPLLAITGILLSVGLVNNLDISNSKVTNTQSVLSKSDEKGKDEEIRTETRIEARIEEKDEIEKDEIENEDSIDDENENEFEKETETASADGNLNRNRFKLKVKTETANSKKVEDAVNNLVEDNVIDEPISFKTNEETDKVEFEVQGSEEKRFLGLIKVVLPKMVTVDANTGEVVSTNQNIWTKFLSLLSI